MNHQRRIATVVHRWTGLALAGFLTIVGLTGATIAWNDQLERVFAPSLFVLPPALRGRPPLDVFTLRERVERATGGAIEGVDWTRAADAPAFFSVAARPGRPAPADDEVAADPATGGILGARRHGDLRQGWVNAMPFIYDLHDSLALGETGTLILGIIALLWTIDCFVGAYLTFPARGAPRRPAASWLWRWAPAWRVRTGTRGYRLLYDLHRAGGLWPWALLFLLAWSSVGFNLPQVYDPVMSLLGSEAAGRLPRVADPAVPPHLSWGDAHRHGQTAMAALARREGFVVRSERLMFYDPGSHTYAYRVLSDRDPGATGNTQVTFDGDSGAVLATSVPTGRAASTTTTAWLGDIHTGDVLGWPLRVALSLVGFTIAGLSITGVWLWWRKRKAKTCALQGRSRSTPVLNE